MEETGYKVSYNKGYFSSEIKFHFEEVVFDVKCNFLLIVVLKGMLSSWKGQNKLGRNPVK